ncbi:solute carrier family 46 member 3-like [Asbolus verrucosus]|uniref:Solute carrier family 46 member 3-like n=1 Tax=Asbolus verrucosus TaxID=1661398 RepID=A0A482W0L9_ASBVE|nr:solute carrier family 46 member 3-like [Asbolus verrucosus]
MASTADLVTESAADKSPEPKTFLKMTSKEKLSYIAEVVTVEPIVAAYVLAATICGPALLNLEVEKSCRSNLAFNDSVCDAILHEEAPNFTVEIKAIQAMVSNMHSWQVPLQSVMPLVLVLFLGSYSDRHKMRKPFLLFPFFGELLAVAGCIVSVIFMKEWSLEVQGVLQTVVPSLFGGQAMLIMAAFAYIADVSTVEMRTLRVGVVQIVLMICLPIAQAASGVLFEKIGYIWMLIMAGGFYTFAIIYGIFWVKEPRQPDVISKKSFIMDAFDPQHAIETFNLLLKKSPGNNRVFILAFLVIYFAYSTVNTGEGSVFYSYIIGPFNWGPTEFSYFITANTIVHLIGKITGTLLGVPLFTHLFHFGDLVILGLTLVDKIVANIIFGLAKTGTMLYVAMVVSVITGISPIAIRSMATKIVSQDDLGKAQSLFGIGEALGPAVAAPIYNTVIFVNTLDTLPSAYFYFGALLYALCMIVIGWMYYATKKIEKSEESPNNLNMNGNVPCIAVDGLKCKETSNGTFTREMPCKWTNGYSFETALLLSIFLGMFGVDRFYLGYPAIGLAKFCTLGFMFLGQLVDIVLIATQVVGPADGSAYVIPYYGPGVQVIRSDNWTYRLKQDDW